MYYAMLLYVTVSATTLTHAPSACRRARVGGSGFGPKAVMHSCPGARDKRYCMYTMLFIGIHIRMYIHMYVCMRQPFHFRLCERVVKGGG